MDSRAIKDGHRALYRDSYGHLCRIHVLWAYLPVILIVAHLGPWEWPLLFLTGSEVQALFCRWFMPVL